MRRTCIHARLAGLLSCVLWLNCSVRASTAKLAWTKPSAGDVYSPGDMISGEWSAGEAVTSPSVSLCAKAPNFDSRSSKKSDGERSSDEGTAGACGTPVWPTVAKSGGTTYSISLMVPDVTEQSTFFLRMKDDFGVFMSSPDFVLSPTTTPATDNSPSDSSSPDGPSAGSGDSSPTGDSLPTDDGSGPSNLSQSVSTVSRTAPQAATSPVSIGPSPTIHAHAQTNLTASPPGPTATRAAGNGTAGADTQPVDDATSARVPGGAPAAAIAVPLALVGATLAASFALCLRHRRTLAQQSVRGTQILSRSGSVCTQGKAGAPSAESDIEKAISALGYDTYDTRPSHPVPRTDARRDCVDLGGGHPTFSSPEFQRQLFFENRQYPDTWRGCEDDREHSAVTDDVLSAYLQPSPLPTPAPVLNRDSYVVLPQKPSRAHSRPQAPSSGNVYDAVSRAVGGL